MNKDIRNITKYLIILMVSMMVLTGCTSQEAIDAEAVKTQLVAEYAAGLLVKYDKNHKMGLARVDGLDISQLYITPTPTPIPLELPEIEELPEEEESDEALVEGGNKKEEVEIKIIPLNEAFGFSNGSLDFSHIERCDSYPQDEALVFSMNASSGHDLLIAHFYLSNDTGEVQNYMTKLNGYKVRAVINGEDKIRCNFTILPNDLTSLSTNLEPSEAEDVVLVFEVPTSQEVVTCDLMLVNGADVMEYNLYSE